jgi:hypothetical protein
MHASGIFYWEVTHPSVPAGLRCVRRQLLPFVRRLDRVMGAALRPLRPGRQWSGADATDAKVAVVVPQSQADENSSRGASHHLRNRKAGDQSQRFSSS